MSSTTPKRLTVAETTRLRKRLKDHAEGKGNPISVVARILAVHYTTAYRMLKGDDVKVGWRRVYAERAAACFGVATKELCGPAPIMRPPVKLPTWEGMKQREAYACAVRLQAYLSVTLLRQYDLVLDQQLLLDPAGGMPTLLHMDIKPIGSDGVKAHLSFHVTEPTKRVMMKIVGRDMFYYGEPITKALDVHMRKIHKNYVKSNLDTGKRDEGAARKTAKRRRSKRGKVGASGVRKGKRPHLCERCACVTGQGGAGSDSPRAQRSKG